MLDYSDIFLCVQNQFIQIFSKCIKEENVCSHRKYDFNFMINADTCRYLFADLHLFKNFSVITCK